jgi:hypothetical protein
LVTTPRHGLTATRDHCIGCRLSPSVSCGDGDSDSVAVS